MKEELYYTKTKKTISFLMGLTESIEKIFEYILAMDILPKVDKAYSLLLRHKQQQDANGG